MIPIGEAIESVILAYNRGRRSRDSRLSTPLVYSTLLNSRADLIRQQSNKNQAINHWIYQTLECVEMATVVQDDCRILRSKYPMPKLISDTSSDLIGTITTNQSKSRFEMVRYETAKYQKGSKYQSNKPVAYLNGGYIFLTNIKMLETLRVPGIFEDTIEVYNFPNSCNPADTCIDYNQLEFPIDRNLLETVIEMANKKLVEFFLQTEGDDRVDSIDDSGLKKGMIHQGGQ